MGRGKLEQLKKWWPVFEVLISIWLKNHLFFNVRHLCLLCNGKLAHVYFYFWFPEQNRFLLPLGLSQLAYHQNLQWLLFLKHLLELQEPRHERIFWHRYWQQILFYQKGFRRVLSILKIHVDILLNQILLERSWL